MVLDMLLLVAVLTTRERDDTIPAPPVAGLPVAVGGVG